mgnify:FL=1
MPEFLSKTQAGLAEISAYSDEYEKNPPKLLGGDHTLEACGVKVDISRQRLNEDELKHLYRIAEDVHLVERHRNMMQGKQVNSSEKRAALHTLLRDPESSLPQAEAVRKNLDEMRKFAYEIRQGLWRGTTGQRITDVINVGIGGSFAGPHFVYDACQDMNTSSIAVHWVSNVDGWVLVNLLSKLSASTTLVIVSSKSFGTAETLLNAETIRNWFIQQGIEGEELCKHFVVVSSNEKAGEKIGVPCARRFPIWDWVGGRFSVWSATGLPLMIALGPTHFDEFLRGAHQMDMHSIESEPEKNLPLTLALLSIWNSIALNAGTLCFLPYEHRLRHMIQWLQQLQMESLGKSRLTNGELTFFPTGRIVWGGLGNDAQHTFFQCLRQGVARTAIDILWADRPAHSLTVHHDFLLANAKAQANVLVTEDDDSLAMNTVNVIRVRDISPYSLGAVMAMYEHKTTMLGNLFGINPFDQPGVELGKRLARDIMNEEQ